MINSIIENILNILKEKNITKKEFASKLIDFNPKVGLNLEPPSERTIYLYLQGKRELKADLIPYIAEVLNIKEQDLFEDRYIQSEYVKENKVDYNCSKGNRKEELIDLLPNLPVSIIQSFINIAKELKKD
ncbi:helix-turn-helix transcriptional regulator [Arcobacteraceae bacterium]|nr:helix-turn-helix transcriptional regulator [Arcobacteraceae bacterium]